MCKINLFYRDGVRWPCLDLNSRRRETRRESYIPHMHVMTDNHTLDVWTVLTNARTTSHAHACVAPAVYCSDHEL